MNGRNFALVQPLACGMVLMRAFDPPSERTKIMVRKFIMALALGGIALTATACNTVKGVGRDVESVGEAGDEAIR